MAVIEKFVVRTALLFSMNNPYFCLIPLIIWRMMPESIEGKGGIYCSYKKRVSMIYLQLKHMAHVRNFFSFGNNLSFETYPLLPMFFYTALLGGIFCL
jgi:hypothetical protein